MPRCWDPSLIVTFDPIVEPIGMSDVKFPVSQAQRWIRTWECPAKRGALSRQSRGDAPTGTTTRWSHKKTKPNCNSVGY